MRPSVRVCLDWPPPLFLGFGSVSVLGEQATAQEPVLHLADETRRELGIRPAPTPKPPLGFPRPSVR